MSMPLPINKCYYPFGFPYRLSGKEPACNAEDTDMASIPESRRSAGGGHGNPLQNSCLENPMDRGAWRAKSVRSQSQILLRGLACTHLYV